MFSLVTPGDDPSGDNLESAMIENRQEKEAEVKQYSQSNCLVSPYQENVFPPEEEKNAGVEGFANTQGNNTTCIIHFWDAFKITAMIKSGFSSS